MQFIILGVESSITRHWFLTKPLCLWLTVQVRLKGRILFLLLSLYYSEKRKMSYADSINLLRRRISFSLLRASSQCFRGVRSKLCSPQRPSDTCIQTTNAISVLRCIWLLSQFIFETCFRFFFNLNFSVMKYSSSRLVMFSKTTSFLRLDYLLKNIKI